MNNKIKNKKLIFLIIFFTIIIMILALNNFILIKSINIMKEKIIIQNQEIKERGLIIDQLTNEQKILDLCKQKNEFFCNITSNQIEVID